jgi:hypothetical protein
MFNFFSKVSRPPTEESDDEYEETETPTVNSTTTDEG